MKGPISVPASLIRDLNAESDYPALSELYAAIEAADRVGAETSEEALRAAGPGRRRWVAEEAGVSGRLIGHGWLQAQSERRWYCTAAVRPERRRQGLGSALLNEGMRKARGLGAVELAAFLSADNQAGQAFLEKHGFRLMGHNRYMKAGPDYCREAPAWPEGFTLRSFAEIGDLKVLADAHNRCYAEHWGHYENGAVLTVEKLDEWMREYPEGFIPEGIFILFDPAGEIAGVSYGRFGAGEPKTRIVDSPGAAPKYRPLQLVRPLALQTMQWLQTQGEGPLELHCFGEEQETVEIYQGLGFRLAPQDDWLELGLVLSPAAKAI